VRCCGLAAATATANATAAATNATAAATAVPTSTSVCGGGRWLELWYRTRLKPTLDRAAVAVRDERRE
jgi:hypothetical protein